MPRRSIDIESFSHTNPIPSASRIGPLVVSSVVVSRDPGTTRVPDDIDAQIAPRQLSRVANGHRFDLLAVDNQMLVIVFDLPLKTTVGAVVLEQSRKHFVVGQIIDRHDFELVRTSVQVAERQTSDTTKTIDCYTNSHVFLLRFLRDDRVAGK